MLFSFVASGYYTPSVDHPVSKFYRPGDAFAEGAWIEDPVSLESREAES